MSDIKKLEKDSKDVFDDGLVEHYIARPRGIQDEGAEPAQQLRNMSDVCLADFAAKWNK